MGFRNVCLKSLLGVLPAGQKRHARMAFLPPAPLKQFIQHTFLNIPKLYATATFEHPATECHRQGSARSPPVTTFLAAFPHTLNRLGWQAAATRHGKPLYQWFT
jgi:hypothetical protein